MSKNHSIARRDHLRRRVRMTTVGATGLAGAASVALTFALAGPASHSAEATTPTSHSTSTAPRPTTASRLPPTTASTSTPAPKPAPAARRPAAAPTDTSTPARVAPVAPKTTVDPSTAPAPVLTIPVQQPAASQGQAQAASGGS